jgi:hypothetical protein
VDTNLAAGISMQQHIHDCRLHNEAQGLLEDDMKCQHKFGKNPKTWMDPQ